MTIVHFGFFSADRVNGVSTYVTFLAKKQVLLGHKVIFCYIGGDPTNNFKNENGVSVYQFKSKQQAILKKILPAGRNDIMFTLPKPLKLFIDQLPPDTIFSFHSVFIHTNQMIAKYLYKKKLNYFITPHGGYSENVFKKNGYSQEYEVIAIKKSKIAELVDTDTTELKDLKFEPKAKTDEI